MSKANFVASAGVESWYGTKFDLNFSDFLKKHNLWDPARVTEILKNQALLLFLVFEKKIQHVTFKMKICKFQRVK
jgi:hypothetical protein